MNSHLTFLRTYGFVLLNDNHRMSKCKPLFLKYEIKFFFKLQHQIARNMIHLYMQFPESFFFQFKKKIPIKNGTIFYLYHKIYQIKHIK